MYNHENYHVLINDLLMFIDKARSSNATLSITDIILDFSMDTSTELEIISEAISGDIYFKKLLMNDCIAKNIIKPEDTGEKLDDNF